MDIQDVSLILEILDYGRGVGMYIVHSTCQVCVILPAQIAMMMLILFQIAMMMLILFQMFKEWPISTQWPVRQFSAFLQGMFSLSSLIAGIVEVV